MANSSGSSPTVWVLLACKRGVFRQEFREVLEGAGYGVEVVDTVSTLTERVRFRHYDAIILDLEGQLEEGLAVTEVIRRMETARGQPATPIIGTVAKGDDRIRERARDAGMDRVAQIDVTPHEIVHQVARAASFARPVALT